MIIKAITAIFREVTNPSLDNPPMWYKKAVVDFAHVFLGVISIWILTSIIFFLHGEYPYKEHVWGLVAGAFLGKEILFDRWNGWDTIRDNWFFSVYGAGGAVMSFSEKAVGDWAPEPNPYWLTLFIVVSCAHIVLDVLWQVKDDV
jgi:hypothetical protein